MASTVNVKPVIEAICKNMGIAQEKIILFGSRGRGDFDRLSDYDILVILREDFNIRTKMELSRKIREALAAKLVGADIIVKSVKEADYYRDKVGSVVRSAIAEGVIL